MRDLRALLHDIPKAEIHLHVEALATVDTIWTLINRHKLSIAGVHDRADLSRRFQINSLDEFIDLFINVVQNCFRHDSDIELLLEDGRNYLKRNNIVYAEIFFAPSKFLKNGLSFAAMMRKLDDGAKTILREENIEIKYIVDVSRSFGVKNAEQNLSLTIEHRTDSVIGIGLGGAEIQGPAKKFEKVFETAAANGLRVVAHAGEDVGPESIWDALNYLHAARIGHGISAIQDKKLMVHLAEKRIPLEICPTSNLFTRKYVTRLQDHPIRAFYDQGICVTLNTDDPTLFGIDLVDEYMKLSENGFFTPAELLEIAKNTVYATFLPQKRKDAIWAQAEKIIKKTPLV